jgi:DNA-binding LytR/AlgR family response regulator
MKVIRILLIEDEPVLAKYLKSQIEHQGIVVSGIADNMHTAKTILKENEIDLALINAQLTGAEDGIYIARELLKIKWVPIIYMTNEIPSSLSDRMQQTFPAAFLEKPLNIRELSIQIQLAVHNFHEGNLPVGQKIDTEFVFLPAFQGYIGVKVKDILYIKADRINSLLFISKFEFERLYPGKAYGPILISANKGSISPRLPSHFYNLSRSFIVNLHHIHKIESTRIFVQSHEISIPEGKRKELISQVVTIKKAS